MDINLSRVHFPVTSLGPGKRLGIWFQGCSIRCRGCISADTWASNRGKTTLERLVQHMAQWLPEAEGITISGGEPFEQPVALIALLQALRQQTSVDILVYSGYPVESLTPILEKASGLIDALISDPFDLSEDHTRPLRGSDNQRMHLLTALGSERFAGYERLLEESDKSLDVMFDADGTVWLAGIPRRGDFHRLKDLWNTKSHVVQISADGARSLQDKKCQH